jgi:hypothetical protein
MLVNIPAPWSIWVMIKFKKNEKHNFLGHLGIRTFYEEITYPFPMGFPRKTQTIFGGEIRPGDGSSEFEPLLGVVSEVVKLIHASCTTQIITCRYNWIFLDIVYIICMYIYIYIHHNYIGSF